MLEHFNFKLLFKLNFNLFLAILHFNFTTAVFRSFEVVFFLVFNRFFNVKDRPFQSRETTLLVRK